MTAKHTASSENTSGPGRPFRLGAILTTSLVTLPGLAVAQEPDRTQEGTAAPEDPGESEADAPNFDPGGDSALLPFDVTPAPDPGDDAGLGESLETEPVPVPDGPVPDTGAIDEPVVQPGEDAPTPPAGEAPADEAPADGPDSAPPTAPPSVPTAPRDASALPSYHLEPEASPPHRSAARLISDAPPRTSIGLPPEPPSNPVEEAPRITVQAATPEPDNEPLVVSARAPDADKNRGARVYMVERGDSLWAIAEDMLGPAASAARISGEVQRLWSLNEDRIGTGDPDLLMVGTELRLS